MYQNTAILPHKGQPLLDGLKRVERWSAGIRNRVGLVKWGVLLLQAQYLDLSLFCASHLISNDKSIKAQQANLVLPVKSLDNSLFTWNIHYYQFQSAD